MAAMVPIHSNGWVHTVVGHHHGDGAEESLQVVGQLCATGVAGVHRDEAGARRHQLDLTALEHEPRQLCEQRKYLLISTAILVNNSLLLLLLLSLLLIIY